jgi:hypothetical protein
MSVPAPKYRHDKSGISAVTRHGSRDDSHNLTFDTARSVEYCLGNLPPGRIPTQEKATWPDADSYRSCWVSHFWQ